MGGLQGNHSVGQNDKNTVKNDIMQVSTENLDDVPMWCLGLGVLSPGARKAVNNLLWPQTVKIK